MEEFGLKLKQIRESHNITLSDVNKNISVREIYLILMEEGKFSELPPVYGKSFLKTYCQYLEIPNSDYIHIIEQLEKEDNSKFKTNTIKTPSKFNLGNQNKKINPSFIDKNNYLEKILSQFKFIENPKFINYFVIILFLSIIMFFLFPFEDEKSLTNQDESLQITESDTMLLAEEEKGLFSYFQSSDSLILEAYSIDTCWLKLNIDGKTNKEVLAVPKMKMRWSAKDYFIITQGNVGAIQFIRNGKNLEPFGARGSVVKNIKITKDEIIY